MRDNSAEIVWIGQGDGSVGSDTSETNDISICIKHFILFVNGKRKNGFWTDGVACE